MVGTRNDPTIVESVEKKGSSTPLFPTPAWANLTNPYNPFLGMDVFAYLAAASGVSNATSPKTEPTSRIYALESAIALMLANGLSRMPYHASLAGTLKGLIDASNEWSGGPWADELMPNKELGYGGNAYEISLDEHGSTVMFTVKAKCVDLLIYSPLYGTNKAGVWHRCYGYAYRSDGATQKAALVVLVLYCLIAVSHTLVNFIDGWDTAPELTALAFNSGRSNAMYNTGAGIHSIKTMEQNVQVRVKDDRLEPVFYDTGDKAAIVRPGRTYH